VVVNDITVNPHQSGLMEQKIALKDEKKSGKQMENLII
jgi:hypothetical protein